jgi:hypothetical protein
MITYAIKHTPIVQTSTQDITFEQVDKLYVGKGNNCRCGCAGEYYYASEPANADIIKKALFKMASGKYEVESIDGYIFEIVLSERLNARGDVGYRKVNTIYLKRSKDA